MAYYRTPHDVTALPAWQALNQHRENMHNFSMREAFNADPQRFNQFTLSSCGLFLDYSKNLITSETRNLLVGLANEVDLQGAIKALFAGEPVNSSEGRPALHTALRRPVGDKLLVNGANVMPDVHKVLNQITELVGRIHDGLWRGYTEKPITDVVNIGIGGSFLGPELVSEALLSYTHKGVRCHYLANIDGSEFHELSAKIRAETTLFIVSSKSFNTLETLKKRPGRACLVPGPGRFRGRAVQALHRRVEQQRRRRGLRHPRREHLPDVGLGRRPLLAVVGYRSADRPGHRHVELQGAAVRCLHHGPALPERTVRTEHAGTAGIAGRLVRQLLGRAEPCDPAVRPLPAQHHQAPATAGHGVQRQERAPGRHARCRPIPAR